MLDLQEISDRLEIQNQLVCYANALDLRDFDRLDEVFTPDAYIDYRALGGVDGSYTRIKAWLQPILANFPAYFHLNANMEITLDGDEARSRTLCFNPMETPLPDGGTQVMFLGLWYRDHWVRTPAGWRISERIEEKSIEYNVPPGITIGPDAINEVN